VAQVAQHTGALLAAGHKVLLFAHHKEVLDALQEALFPGSNAAALGDGGGGPPARKRRRGSAAAAAAAARCFVRIDGAVTAGRRDAAVAAFQADEGVRAALLSITAAGVGVTLTAATVVVFAELWWTPGALVQAEDRAHRLGQRRQLEVHYLTAAGSADDVLWRSLGSKLGVVSGALGDGARAPAAAAGGGGGGCGGCGGGNVFADVRVAARYESVQQRLSEEAAAAAGARGEEEEEEEGGAGGGGGKRPRALEFSGLSEAETEETGGAAGEEGAAGTAEEVDLTQDSG
jgi:SWI/SNF-related matrix-associated actin-dependent regulator 1 of chromatin subfamily A